MKIRLKRDMLGTFHSIESPKKGDIVEVDEANGVRYCALGYAEPVTKSGDRKVEKRVVEEGENAVAEGVELTTQGGPVDEPTHAVDAEALDMEAVIGGPVESGYDAVDSGAEHPERGAKAEALDPNAVIHDKPREKPKVLDEQDDSVESDDSPARKPRPRRSR